VGAAPALAEGTAGIEPTGKAEKATTAKSEALVPWAQAKAKRGLEGMLREGELAYKWPPVMLPPEGEHEVETPPQEGKRTHKLPPKALPQKGEHKPEAPP
jgi:hypothetical protein